MDQHVIVFTILIFLGSSAAEYCIQGEDEGCRFECHCVDDDECRRGTCPSGCHTAALEYNWGGPACQIGNVGLYKAANMTTTKPNYNLKYPPTGALDGILGVPNINQHCAYPINAANLAAEWWADLGDIYKIYNITIYGRTDKNQNRLHQFELTVYNISNNEALCAYHEGTILTYETISCNKSLIGRYVHFKNTGRPIHVTGLCEVVIIGHKVFDCSNCPSDVTCYDVTGCQKCVGSYQPECKPDCRSGSYGTNCNKRCGQCKTNNNCHTVTGQCTDGCELWWTGNECKIYIDKPMHRNESIEVLSTTSDSVRVKCQMLNSIPANLSQYYGYVVVYKENSSLNYTTAISKHHTSSRDDLVVDVENLLFNTKYDIEVRPYRKINEETDFGSLYETLHVKTKCKAPDSPTVWNVTATATDLDVIPNLNIIYYPTVSDLNPNCDQINEVSLNYELTDGVKHSKIITSLTDNMATIVPEEVGQYQIWITVTNNEGYSSDSEKYTISIKKGGEAEPGSSDSTMIIIIGAAVSGIILIIIIVFVIVMVMRKRRKSSTSERQQQQQQQQHVNDSFITDDTMNESVENSTCTFDLTKHSSPSKRYQQTDASDQSSVSSLDDDNMSMKETELDDDYDDDADEEEEDDDDDVDDDNPMESEECLYANSAVNVVNFEGYLANRKKKIRGLYKEYELLPQKDLKRCKVAVLDQNKDKNRFIGIYPYDETRVLLEAGDNNKSDYINASYITGYNKTKEYIATQGPKRNTLIDFWRMVWQHNANRIVMVANVSEMGKTRVEPYWCEKPGDSRLLGDFNIKTDYLESSADYDTRIMTVKKGNQSRIVRHFHFKTWEDKGKPQYGPHTLLAFMNRIHSLDKHGHGPLIVHCSAGVGRTGSFIALDILQQMATKQQSVDIYNCVDRLRRERMFMVQTKEQYVFLHQTIVEFIKYTNTSHDCNRFSQKFASVLDQQADPEIMSIMEVELKHLTEQNPNTRSDNKSGLKEENKDKNRNLELVPDDSKRLFISGIVGNYINAISSDSFAAHNSRVVTQMPLPQTMADFWKLIMGENCRGIIMLNQLDNTDPTCIPYWPKEINGKKTYGQIKVELLATDEDTKSGFIVKRDFRVTEIKQREFGPANTMTVRQFQLISWPNDQILPPQRKHLLDLMDHLQSWQQSSKDSAEKGKVLVHCIDGGSRSGIFCGVSFMLDRMRIEQDVNVYLSARYVSRNRPQFFDNILEYQFLYQMAVEHLTESKEYANVR